MPVSQNLRFAAIVQEDSEHRHPPGAELMRRLTSELTAAGWNSEEFDNWRDCGWSVVCRRNLSILNVVVSQIKNGQWLLQVSPKRRAGFIGSLFGSKSSATVSDVHELALAVHHALSALRYLGSPQWQWDQFPDGNHSTPEPRAA